VITRSRIWARLCLFQIGARQAEALVGLLQGPALPPALTIGNVNPKQARNLPTRPRLRLRHRLVDLALQSRAIVHIALARLIEEGV
jgi:hypothetical protein